MTNEDAEKFPDLLSSYLNSYGSERNKAVIEYMARDHRSLQQSFTRLCVQWLEHIAQNDACDARNEASVRIAKEFVNNVKNRNVPFI